MALNSLTFFRWWFHIFCMFIPIWGRFPIWLIFFNWVETTNQLLLLSKCYISFQLHHPTNPSGGPSGSRGTCDLGVGEIVLNFSKKFGDSKKAPKVVMPLRILTHWPLKNVYFEDLYTPAMQLHPPFFWRVHGFLGWFFCGKATFSTNWLTMIVP